MTGTARLPRRVCFAPTDVASYYSGLREGLEILGVKSWFFSFAQTKYDRYRPKHEDTLLERIVFRIASASWLACSRRGRAIRVALLFPLRVLSCLVAAVFCDVFIFAYGQT